METNICAGVDAYLSGAMDLAEKSAFELHLAICSKCQECKTQSQAIERMLFEQNACVMMRPQFQEQNLTLLRGVNKDEGVEQRKLPGARAVTLDNHMPLGFAGVVVAALILWIVVSISKQSIDESLLHPNTNANANGRDLAQSQIGPKPSSQKQEVQPIAVIASPGYLCARVESEEPDVEFYIVRPALQKN